MSDFGIEIDRKQYMKYFGCSPGLIVRILAGEGISKEIRQKIRDRKTVLFVDKLSHSLQTTPGIFLQTQFTGSRFVGA
jgi:hypothetical protein